MVRRLLDPERCALLLIDAQERLMAAMERRESTLKNMVSLIRLAEVFGLPLILTEQNPKALGPTVDEIKAALPIYEPLHKLCFDACRVEAFQEAVKGAERETLLLCGVETHICVFQTAVSLLEWGYEVHVPRDAVDSRTGENRQAGLELIRDAGGVVSSTEAIIFQCLREAGTPAFARMLEHVR